MKINKVNILKPIVATLVLFLIFFSKYYVQKRYKNLKQIGKISIAYIYESGGMGAQAQTVCRYYYYVDGVKYYGVDSYYESEFHTKEGEYYEIIYHPDKHSFKKILFDKKVPKDSVCSYFKGDCPFSINSK